MSGVGNPNWTQGQSGNANGRPVGKRDNKYRKYQTAAEEENLPDPVIFQHRKLADESIDISLRAQIASNISSYFYPKWGTTSPPPAPVLIANPIDLKPPTTIEDAKANIALLVVGLGNGTVDHASYDRLIAGNVAMINALLGQEKLLAAQGGGTGEQTIRILGGLPPLVLGPNDGPLIMPELNGHKSYELVEHQSSGNGPSPSPSVGPAK
jgi:hypothetical protein